MSRTIIRSDRLARSWRRKSTLRSVSRARSSIWRA
ncbi:hypothetical protein [uncultured Sphingomonas sp.]